MDMTAARSILLPRTETPGAPLGQIGLLCEELGLQEDAERLLKRFAAPRKESPPQAILTLAAYYGRRGRIADALKVCDEARTKVAIPLVGNTAVVALYAAAAPKKEDVAKVASWLEDAAGKATPEDRAALLQKLASIRNLQGEFAASADLYRRAIDANGKDALAMNNLAFLLSTLEKKHDEALKLLDRAKRQIGPNPILAHTESLVRLNKGDFEIACRLLTQVSVERGEGPVYLHLAQAEWKAGRKVEARRAWQRSIDLGEKLSELHPLEIPEYEKLEQLLK
jgi:tetratricopeptide (TPR) repeat protein